MSDGILTHERSPKNPALGRWTWFICWNATNDNNNKEPTNCLWISFFALTLFLTDMPSTSRILPLVHPSNLQITSRGRVIFNILPAGQMESLNDVTSYVSFLSPEYLNGAGKMCTFVESDIEKVTSLIYDFNCSRTERKLEWKTDRFLLILDGLLAPISKTNARTSIEQQQHRLSTKRHRKSARLVIVHRMRECFQS